MRFTPTAGVPMGTRSGDLDPGLLCYPARTDGLDPTRLSEIVTSQSGMLGVSETSSDMRDLLEHEPHEVRARESVALFSYQVKKWISAFAAAIGGLDIVVFAGGIGENAPDIRPRLCEGLGFLSIELDQERNCTVGGDGAISAAHGRVDVRVIHTDEERVMAQMTGQVLGLTHTKETSP